MSKDIGNERVLTALAETVGGFSETVVRWDEGDTAVAGDEPTVASPPEAGAGVPDARGARYAEGELLGRGGLGEVRAVYDRDLRREVALKRPRPDRLGASHVASLVAEAQVQAQLEHPNVPAVHALGVDGDGRPFFTMTRLQGQTLSALLRERQTDPELRRQVTTGRLLRIFLQVGSAVAFAHERRVVHRDIKPENVILGGFGEVRVVDWGIALLLDPEGTTSAQEPGPVTTAVAGRGPSGSGAAGTPGYAAPEQLQDDAEVDERADVYGLGALLYEMLAGRPPVVGETVAERIEATRAGQVSPLLQHAPVSERLAAIVHKALATDPAERYADVVTMLQDVEAVLEGRPVSALQEGLLKKLGRAYLSRSNRYSRFRTVDIDMLCWSMFAFGLASGIGVLLWTTSHLNLIAAVALVVAVLTGLVPLYTTLRRPRPDDPGVVIPFSEGLTTARGTSGRPDPGDKDK